MPQKTLSDKKRWVTTYDIKDNRPESQGFCKNGYFDGLDPDEYFAQAQSGREGLIGTAVMTKKSGHLYKRILKAQEDLLLIMTVALETKLALFISFAMQMDFQLKILSKILQKIMTVFILFSTLKICADVLILNQVLTIVT